MEWMLASSQYSNFICDFEVFKTYGALWVLLNGNGNLKRVWVWAIGAIHLIWSAKILGRKNERFKLGDGIWEHREVMLNGSEWNDDWDLGDSMISTNHSS